MTTSSKRYYEVTGDTREGVRQVFKLQTIALRKAQALAKELKADQFIHSTGGFGTKVLGFSFKKGVEPDPKLLRPYYNRKEKKHEDWYVPNRSTKIGKALSRRLDKEFRIPSVEAVADVIKLKCFTGSHWRRPGVRRWGPRDRIFVIIPMTGEKADYSPRGKLAGDMKRVSDVEFEKLEKKYGKKEKKAVKKKRKRK